MESEGKKERTQIKCYWSIHGRSDALVLYLETRKTLSCLYSVEEKRRGLTNDDFAVIYCHATIMVPHSISVKHWSITQIDEACETMNGNQLYCTDSRSSVASSKRSVSSWSAARKTASKSTFSHRSSPLFFRSPLSMLRPN